VPKPPLVRDDAILESMLIETFLAGCKEWRPDLHYPESYSDMQAGVRGLMKMFKIERRPLPTMLRIECHVCNGHKNLTEMQDGLRKLTTCPECKGKGYLPGT